MVSLVLFVASFFTLTAGVQETAASTSSGQAASFQATASHNFGQSLQFRLVGDAGHPTVTQATLLFTFPTAERIYAQPLVPPSPQAVLLEQLVAVQNFNIRPFAPITYWWELQTANGRITLPQQTHAYNDNQLAWVANEQPSVTVHALPDEQDLGQLAEQAQAIVAETLPRLRQTTGLTLTTPVPLYLYPSTADFQRTARLANYAPPAIITGADLGVLLQTAVNPRTASQDLARDLPREIVRLTLVQRLGRAYADLPAWLVEGLAAQIGEMTLDEAVLETAVFNQQTFSLDSLCEPQPFAQNEPLALAQSSSLLHHLAQQHGRPIHAQLLSELAQGADCATLTLRTLNIDNDALTQQWLTSQQQQMSGQQRWRRNSVWLLLLLGSSLLLVTARLRRQQ